MANKNNRNNSKVKQRKAYNRKQEDGRQNVNEKTTRNKNAGEDRANKKENNKGITSKKASRRMNRGKKASKENAKKTKPLARVDKRLTHVKNKSKQHKYTEMILKAFSAVVKPTSLSWQTILKYIYANFEVKDKTIANRQLKIALKWCITNNCTTFHRYPIYSTRYSVMCKVYTGYCGTSEIEHGLCACTVDNPLAKARGLSLRTGAQPMLYLQHI